MIQPSVIHLQAYIADQVIGAVCILGSQYVYINKIHKIWQGLPDFMYFINVNILGSQYAHGTNDLIFYVGLKMTD